MVAKNRLAILLISTLLLIGCSTAVEEGAPPFPSTGLAPSTTVTVMPSATFINPTVTSLPTIDAQRSTQAPKTPTLRQSSPPIRKVHFSPVSTAILPQDMITLFEEFGIALTQAVHVLTLSLLIPL